MSMSTNQAFGIFVGSKKKKGEQNLLGDGRFIFLSSNKCVCKNAVYFASIRISMYRVGDKITFTILLSIGKVFLRECMHFLSLCKSSAIGIFFSASASFVELIFVTTRQNGQK